MTTVYNAPPGFEMNPNGMAAKCQALIKGAEHDKRANDEEIAELKESYALLFKSHADQRKQLERSPITKYDVHRLWLGRMDRHDGDLLLQLQDFARAVEQAHGIGA